MVVIIAVIVHPAAGGVIPDDVGYGAAGGLDGRFCCGIDGQSLGDKGLSGGGEGQEDKAEGEEEGGENAARFHLGDFLSLAKPIQFICNAKDSVAGMKKRP